MLTKFRSKGKGFVLLEVLVAIVIIGVAMVAIMRAFVMALDSIKKIQLNEKAMLLAESAMDDLMVEPPAEGDYDGRFSEDPRYGKAFEDWLYEIEIEAEEPDYQERPRGKMAQDLEYIYHVRLKIIYDDDDEEKTVLDLRTILMEPDIFSEDAIQANQMF